MTGIVGTRTEPCRGGVDVREADRAISGHAASLSYAAISHPGRTRRRNEDTFWVDEGQKLFIVADGMGGQRRGAEAARAAVTAIGRALDGSEPRAARVLPEALRLPMMWRKAFLAANDAVRGAAPGGGTTLDVLYVRADRAHIAHVGDSRIYLLRAQRLEQLTRDHTVGAERAARVRKIGRDAEPAEAGGESAEGWSSAEAQALTRVLGSSAAEARPDCRSLELLPGDQYLLCSDGLSGLVADARIGLALGEHWGDPTAAARRLVAEALEAGGTDNVTVLVISV